MEKWNSRKLIVLSVAHLINVGLLVGGFISADAFVSMFTIFVMGYVGGNVGEHAVNRKGSSQ